MGYFAAPISTMKLQKLAYLAQGWSLGLLGEPMFDAEFQAWASGPVSCRLFGQHTGQYSVASWPSGDASALSQNGKLILDAVLKNYGALSGPELSRITRQSGTPWRKTRTRAEVPNGAHPQEAIADDLIAAYFRSELLPEPSAV